MEKNATVDRSKALSVIGIDRNRFSYLFRFGHDGDAGDKLLQTEFTEPLPGEAAKLTRENCLEIAFIDRFASAGVLLPIASRRAIELLKLEREGNLPRWWIRPWHRGTFPSKDGLLFDDGEAGLGLLARRMAPTMGAMIDGKPPCRSDPIEATRIYAENLAEIVRMIDGLFADEGQ